MDWETVPVEGEVKNQPLPAVDDGTSVLSPNYRPRSSFGLQELGGLVGSVMGGAAGMPFGFPGIVAGGATGAAAGGALGEYGEQYLRGEPTDVARIGKAGLEEALWDAGANLTFKVGGKIFKVAKEKLGFGPNDIPDATKAAQEYLQRQGSSLPKPALYDSGVLGTLESVSASPVTIGIFKKKQKEIEDALMSGNTEILTSLAKNPEFDLMLKQGISPQRASGQVLQNFVHEGEKALDNAVAPQYAKIFADTNSRISTFSIKQWAQNLLSDPAALTAGQRSILKEMETLPPQLDVKRIHEIRSRWLAENRDKYSALGTEKDSRAVGTISDLVKKLDEAMDFAATKTLDKNTLDLYRKVTKTYREGIQGLQTESIREALAKAPEEVGGFLFAAGKETPVNELYRSIAAAQTLSGKSSNEIVDALRYGYLQALTNTPENILKFAKDLEQSQAVKNTFNRLFPDGPTKEAILAMNEAAKKGLIEPKATFRSSYMATSSLYGIGGALAATGYSFALSPEQQDKLKDNLPGILSSAGALLLSQRQITKMLLDPKGAKALSYLARAKERVISPSAFAKLVVEPLRNLYEPEDEQGRPILNPLGTSVDWSTVPVEK